MKPYRSSPSQVATAELCFRKWAFLKIDKRTPPSNKFAAWGTKTHGHLEAWFLHRTPPPDTPEGRAARAILAHLPPPQTPGIEVEKEIRATLGGVPFKGYIDLRILEGRDVPFVSDHKTTGDLKWAKTPDDLVNDVAATIYAYDTMCAVNSTACDLQWTYATRHKSTKTLPVRRRVTLDEIRPRLDKTAIKVAEMRTIFEHAPPALEVPYDAGGCEAFGGCPFRDDCNLSPQERIRSIMGQEQHSAFLAKLRNKRGGNSAPETHPPDAEPTTAPPAEPVPTAAGTVNPPEAPAEAATAPPPEPSKPAKTKRKRRTKKEIEADKAAKAAATATPAPKPPATAPATSTPPEPAPTPAAPPSAPLAASLAAGTAPVAGNLLQLLNAQFVEGFKAGFAEGRNK